MERSTALGNTAPYTLPADAVWFITGCSSGMGEALALRIATHPTQRVVATARNPSSMTSIPDSPNVLKLALDVTSPTAIDAAIASTVAKFGRIDVLVNNAGYGLLADTEAVPEEISRPLMDTHFWGTVALSQHAVRVMREENPKNGSIGGVVINVTSFGGFLAYPGNAFYHAAKFAVEGFTEGIAQEMRPEWNIHFCIAEPGAVVSKFATPEKFKAGPFHPAYAAADSPTQAVLKEFTENAAPENWATSEAAVKVMYNAVAVEGKPIPIRLPVGQDAWVNIEKECRKVLGQLETVKELSFSTGVRGVLAADPVL